jgi:hypothetical protein
MLPPVRFLGQRLPLAARRQHVENAVQNLAHIDRPLAAAVLGGWDHGSIIPHSASLSSVVGNGGTRRSCRNDCGREDLASPEHSLDQDRNIGTTGIKSCKVWRRPSHGNASTTMRSNPKVPHSEIQELSEGDDDEAGKNQNPTTIGQSAR